MKQDCQKCYQPTWTGLTNGMCVTCWKEVLADVSHIPTLAIDDTSDTIIYVHFATREQGKEYQFFVGGNLYKAPNGNWVLAITK